MPPTYRELVKTAIKRIRDDLESKAATAATEKQTARASRHRRIPSSSANATRSCAHRPGARQHLDLGHSLIHNLTNVDRANTEVARFFVLCGCPHGTNSADCMAPPMGGDGGLVSVVGPEREADSVDQDAGLGNCGRDAYLHGYVDDTYKVGHRP